MTSNRLILPHLSKQKPRSCIRSFSGYRKSFKPKRMATVLIHSNSAINAWRACWLPLLFHTQFHPKLENRFWFRTAHSVVWCGLCTKCVYIRQYLGNSPGSSNRDMNTGCASERLWKIHRTDSVVWTKCDLTLLSQSHQFSRSSHHFMRIGKLLCYPMMFRLRLPNTLRQWWTARETVELRLMLF